jgi:hypothetical protein
MQLDKNQIRIVPMKSPDFAARKAVPAVESVLFVWELTKEIYSLSGKFDVESGLQRHIVSVKRKLIINNSSTGRDKDRLDVDSLNNI